MRNSPQSTLLNKQNAHCFSFLIFIVLNLLLCLVFFFFLLWQTWPKVNSKTAAFQKIFFSCGPAGEGLFTALPVNVRLGVWAPQNETLLSKLYTILQQRSPRKKSIADGAPMPISPPIAASTEQNACTSPFLGSFLIIWTTGLSSAHRSMVPTPLFRFFFS